MKRKLLFILCLFILLQSCISTPSETGGTRSVPSLTPTNDIAVETPKPQETKKPPLPDVINSCTGLKNNDSVDVNGYLLLDSYANSSYSLMNLNDGNIKRISNSFPLINPENNYIITTVCEKNCEYIIQDAQKIINTIPVHQDWVLRKWLDNQHVIISIYSSPQDFLIINVFTGEIEKKSLNINNPFTIYQTNDSSIIPFDIDPLVRIALFLNESNGGRIVVWDLNGGKEINSLPHLVNSAVGLEYPYSWSSDGSSYLITSPNDSLSNSLYKVTASGEVQRLTFYDQQYSLGNVTSPAWSPDANHIAFWLKISEESGNDIEDIPQYLSVMNIRTLEVKVYCQTSGAASGGIITWGGDSNHLFINTRTQQDVVEPLVIDLVNLTKTKISTKNSFILGWIEP